jgi:hypothetical protein
MAPFRGDVQYQVSQSFKIVPNLALGDPVAFAAPPATKYSGGPAQLTDGILGGTDLPDSAWAGWEGVDMDASIDLGKSVTIKSVDTRFLQDSNEWILMPRSVSLEVSNDDRAWQTLQTIRLDSDPDDTRTLVRDVAFTPKSPVTARYLHVTATRYGEPVNGLKTWIFSDEIIVK